MRSLWLPIGLFAVIVPLVPTRDRPLPRVDLLEGIAAHIHSEELCKRMHCYEMRPVGILVRSPPGEDFDALLREHRHARTLYFAAVDEATYGDLVTAIDRATSAGFRHIAVQTDPSDQAGYRVHTVPTSEYREP